MEIFADQIKRQLEIRNGSAIDHCAITDEELQRIWLLDEMGSRKKDRAVREGARIVFDVLQGRNVRDFRNTAE
jgi:hypothetical protein